MAKIEFETGSAVKIKGTFKTPKDGIPPNTLINPSIVTLAIRKPDKTTDTYVFGVDAGVTNPSTGLFLFELVLSQQGTYHWRYTGQNGTAAAVITGTLDSVLEPNF